MKKRDVLLGALCVFLLSACTGEQYLKPYPGLANTVNDYYHHERNQDWDDAYALRSPGFRKSMPAKRYKNIMLQDSSGWTLATYSILGAKENGDKIEVT